MSGYQRRASREIYRNPWLAFQVHDVIHPSGATGEHGLVETPAASAAIVADDGDLLFARQPRFAVDAVMLEIVKGGADDGEDALACAKREVREELGVVAAQWESLGVLYEIPSIVREPVSLFLARGIEHVEAAPEDVETIELVRIPEAVAFAAAASGQINDAITVAALLRYGLRTGALRAPPHTDPSTSSG
ncbi:MAG TPA: NUDIX hydrolase [Candidatus Baltobacteraceae bacterium]|jgi:ADP-ribose pyrophosphatase